MEDLLENFTDEELKDELKSRGFTVFNEDSDAELKKFLRNCDYLDEMVEIINDKSKHNLVINDHNNGIDFRKHDCKSLIEDIIRQKGWNYLYEVLYKFDS